MNRGIYLLAAVLAAGVVAFVLQPQAGRWQIIMGQSQGEEVIVAVDTATGWTYWRQPGKLGWNPVPSPK
jgi:DsbC/DsbD-like thiol-disulfide interchange protein